MTKTDSPELAITAERAITAEPAITAEGPIVWNEGGTAGIQSIRELDVVLRSSVPYPPGKPAGGTVVDGTMRYGFTAKVQRSTKVAEGVWDIRARLTSATNELRLAFDSALATQHARTTPKESV